MIIAFLGVGVLVLVLIVFFGVRSSQRKARTNTRSWHVNFQQVGGQPFIESSSVDLADQRQWGLFLAAYPIGARIETVSAAVTAEPGAEPAIASYVVSRVSKSLREGWPQAKLGFTAYFREFEGVEFPVRYAVKADRRISALNFDAAGVTGLDGAGQSVWSSPWAQLRFSNGSDLMLNDGSTTIHVEFPKGEEEWARLEELVIKYGTLKQMHF